MPRKRKGELQTLEPVEPLIRELRGERGASVMRCRFH